jgi:hypothetical protein
MMEVDAFEVDSICILFLLKRCNYSSKYFSNPGIQAFILDVLTCFAVVCKFEKLTYETLMMEQENTTKIILGELILNFACHDRTCCDCQLPVNLKL